MTFCVPKASDACLLHDLIPISLWEVLAGKRMVQLQKANVVSITTLRSTQIKIM